MQTQTYTETHTYNRGSTTDKWRINFSTNCIDVTGCPYGQKMRLDRLAPWPRGLSLTHSALAAQVWYLGTDLYHLLAAMLWQ